MGPEGEVSQRTRTVLSEHEADLVIAAKEPVAEDVVALELTDPDGGDAPAWTPGAHIDLVLSDQLTRQYSLCGSAADRRRWRVGVLKDPGSRGGSAFVHEALPIGSTVRVRGPRNHFPLDRLAALPVHRRRHRDHAPDPDDRRGGRRGRRLAAPLRRAAARLHGLRRRARGPRRPRPAPSAGRARDAGPRLRAGAAAARDARLLLRPRGAPGRGRGRSAARGPPGACTSSASPRSPRSPRPRPTARSS